jgi:predicted Fe-S protein YdhL (DUF1289 family)
MSSHDRRIESPCINDCIIDSASDLCLGCYRTLDEIAEWGSMPAEERRAVLDAARRRRTAAEND